MDPHGLTEAEREALIERLATALEQMMDTSCLDMGPLWLEQTRQVRKNLGDATIRSLGFQPSPRYLRLAKGGRSKYRYLACWRHACLYIGALQAVGDASFRRALQVVYFTPFTANAPPYAWSSRASDAPGAEEFPTPTTLKHYAKEGAYSTVLLVIERVLALDAGHAWIEANLLKLACRRTLRDVLKLDDFDPWEEP